MLEHGRQVCNFQRPQRQSKALAYMKILPKAIVFEQQLFRREESNSCCKEYILTNFL